MKTSLERICLWLRLPGCGLLALACFTATADSLPTLALPGVTLAPTLARKIESKAPAPASTNGSLAGTWSGVLPPNHGTWAITVKNTGNGSLQALFENRTGRTSFVSTEVASDGNHLKITFYNDHSGTPNLNIVEADVNADFGLLKGIWGWNTPRGWFRQPFSFRRADAPNAVANRVDSVATAVQSIDSRMADRFNDEHLFKVMGDADLKRDITPTGTAYDLSNPTIAGEFKKAGVAYLATVSIENYSDQTVEKRRTKDYRFQNRVYGSAGVYYSRYGRLAYGTAGATPGASRAEQGGIDPEVWMHQTVKLTVRCQLHDARTGDLKKSATTTFPLNRDYTAVANGRNEVSTDDLFESIGGTVSEWVAGLVDDAIFPIKVLAKNDDDITISRGSQAGLKVGQVFEVAVKGAELKSPDNGQVLGYDVKTVGRVAITKLEPNFSHARVLSDDGIVPGATLARMAP